MPDANRPMLSFRDGAYAPEQFVTKEDCMKVGQFSVTHKGKN